MKPPTNTRQTLSSSDQTKILLVTVFLAILLLVLGILLGLLLRRSGFQFSFLATLRQTSTTQPAPTPQCIEPTLALGTATFHVKAIRSNPNTFPTVPQDTPDTAYWVEGTTVNYVFGLSPRSSNLALNTSLKAGDPMVISWGDCSKDEYILHSLDMTQPNDLSFFDQSRGGITVYVQTGASNLVIRGDRPIVQPVDTTQSEPTSEFRIDVAFSDQPSADPQTVRIGLTITNRGKQAITLNNNDISLTVENNPEMFPSFVDPVLPHQINPGSSTQIVVTFPKPETSNAVLRIFDTTLDYYF